jgi:hypothetical protein
MQVEAGVAQEIRHNLPILSYRRKPVSMAEVNPGLRRDDDEGGLSFADA